MTIHLSTGVTQGRAAVVRPVGEVDCATAPLVQAAFDGALLEAADDLVVDLSATTFMDAAGLTLLVQARRDWGGRLRLYRPPASLRRILRALEMEAAFTIVDPPTRDPWPPGLRSGLRSG